MDCAIQKRKVNIVLELANRRLGNTTIAKFWSACGQALVHSTKRRAKCVWHRASKKLISSENDKFFVDNFGTCYANFGRNGLPEALYSLKAVYGRSTVEDAVWIEAPLTFSAFADSARAQDVHFGLQDTERSRLRNSIILLLSNRHLIRCDLHCGELLDDFALPFGTRLNWRYVEWNEFQESFAVKSCLVKRDARRPVAGATDESADGARRQRVNGIRVSDDADLDDMAFMFVVFDCVPFAAAFSFSVDQSVFSESHDVCDAGLHSNLLCIGVRKQNTLSLYDCSELFRSAKTDATGRTAVYNRVREAPPCLLRVPYCAEYNLEFGGFPWSIRYSKRNQDDRIRMFTLTGCKPCDTTSTEPRGVCTQEVAQKIVLDGNVSGEPESVVFFEDESGRVAHFAHDRLVLYKLQQREEHSAFQLEQQLTIERAAAVRASGSCSTTNGLRCIDEGSGMRSFVTSSGRLVKPSQRERHDESDAKPRTLHSVEYDDDLQSILCLFSEYRKRELDPCNRTSRQTMLEELVFVAAFYDACTGAFQREFELEMPLEVQREPDLYSHSLSFFMETISLTHVMRHCAAGNNLIKIYRLAECD